MCVGGGYKEIASTFFVSMLYPPEVGGGGPNERQFYVVWTQQYPQNKQNAVKAKVKIIATIFCTPRCTFVA